MRIDERIARLRACHDAGLLASWLHVDELGRQRLTPLAAFAPEVMARGYDARVCPEDAMPGWLAEALELFGQLDEPAFDEVVGRFVALAPRLFHLPAERLERLDSTTRAVALRAARRRTTEQQALAAIDRVLVLLEAAEQGTPSPESIWRDAREHAAAVARACVGSPGAAAAHAACGRDWSDARFAAYATAMDGLEGSVAGVAQLMGEWMDAWERACEGDGQPA
jgi:hypothetical protein